MQASVHRFDESDGSGSVLMDNGRELTFPASAFRTSGLLHLRVGQRVSVEVGAEGVSRLWITGVGSGQRIR